MTTEVSIACREFIRSRLLSATDGFNATIKTATSFYGYPVFQLSAKNLYLGRYTVDQITRSGNSNPYPIAILSVVKSDSVGKQAMRVTPSTFSGLVVISLDFIITYGQSDPPPDGEIGYMSLESALVDAIQSPNTFQYTPQGVLFNNEFMGEQGSMEWDGSRWLQTNSFAFFFNRVT